MKRAPVENPNQVPWRYDPVEAWVDPRGLCPPEVAARVREIQLIREEQREHLPHR